MDEEETSEDVDKNADKAEKTEEAPEKEIEKQTPKDFECEKTETENEPSKTSEVDSAKETSESETPKDESKKEDSATKAKECDTPEAGGSTSEQPDASNAVDKSVENTEENKCEEKEESDEQKVSEISSLLLIKDEEKEAEPETDDNEDVSTLQLAWEVVEVAKALFLKKEDTESQLKVADCLEKLAEIGCEKEDHEQAITDLLVRCFPFVE